MNNIIIYFLIILVLHFYMKIYLLNSDITENTIEINDNVNPTNETSLIDINDYDNDASQELLNYLDNEKIHQKNDIQNLSRKSIKQNFNQHESINHSFNNLSNDVYTFDEVPTNSNVINKKDLKPLTMDYDSISPYENSDNYFSL